MVGMLVIFTQHDDVRDSDLCIATLLLKATWFVFTFPSLFRVAQINSDRRAAIAWDGTLQILDFDTCFWSRDRNVAGTIMNSAILADEHCERDDMKPIWQWHMHCAAS